ncbi:hypothetical protein HanPSC8_Chr05g0214851 [Helianthus annuus]|nr:hypothetical protein HanPSC8_Chr05g0214851 [Helianthus annuus]
MLLPSVRNYTFALGKLRFCRQFKFIFLSSVLFAFPVKLRFCPALKL